jgi:ferritin-like metal-binding protein YciE
MDPKTLVLQYLDEAHATETALVTNLRAHLAMTTDDAYRKLLERHLKETQQHERHVAKRREELGGTSGRGVVAGAVGLARDAVGQALVLSKGPLDAVRTVNQQERMLKNAKDECATEALEIATYDALEAAAKAAGDDKTARMAADHRKQEEQMLGDLRKQINKLAVASFEARTGTAPKRSSSSRSSSSRSSSSSSRSKAAGAKSSRSGSGARSSRSRSTASKS